jgi:UDP-glucuronate 4-epimerase
MALYLVTGGAGFIGSHLVEALAARGDEVRILDSFDDFYDPRIKRRTAEHLGSLPGVSLVEGDLRDADVVRRALDGVDKVAHLGARPGVRASLDDPRTTLDVNVRGTLEILEGLRHGGCKALVFASSSSVYGGDAALPFRETAPASRPLSPYAASKRAGEHLCATYAELFGVGALALRFFTVYGPRGRPDMSVGKFTRRAFLGEPIPLFGDGSVIRDFTYVTDIVAGVVAALDRTAAGGGYEVVNIGGGSTATMKELMSLIEEATGAQLIVERHPAAAGDMPKTHADLTRARELLGFASTVPLAEGVRRTAAWTRTDLGLE